MIGAYILAGELAAARGDHATAFAAYERRLRDLVLATRKMGRGPARGLGGRGHFVGLRTPVLRRLAPIR